MIDIKTSGQGKVKISDDALAVIAGTAAMEAEGIAGLSGNLAEGVSGKLGRKNLAKGIIVSTEDDTVRISTAIIVKLGVKIHEVSCEVQQKIKTAIETMTGLIVSEVNVTVCAAADKNRSA